MFRHYYLNKNNKFNFGQSEAHLKKSLEVIPLGSQTFSKSHIQFPFGASPYFIERGHGSHIWDIDGNEYIDLVNGLLAVSLGYCDSDVDAAVLQQLQKGVTFSLATQLEEKLARKMVELIPSAEMVRFSKNGTDATSGAVRIARAATGRDHVLVCGYHGWQDWYIGSTSKNLGVPACTQELTHNFQYNNLDSLVKLFEQYKGQVAAVILEPMNSTYPQDNFLHKVQEVTRQNGALFILDETITGFRYALGGAQEYFGVIPDLSTFGKGMGNGFPISALVGKKDYMELMSEVFLSSTFGGEALSLAAAYAVISKMQQVDYISHISSIGSQIICNATKIINELQLQHIFQVVGHPSWSFITMQDNNGYSSWEIKTLWMQECIKRGVFTFGTHNISFAHSLLDVAHINEVYSEVFEVIAQALAKRQVHFLLKCEPLKPLFKVR
jgi:glutamate-1-semialdehyde 2,1-aminomutase